MVVDFLNPPLRTRDPPPLKRKTLSRKTLSRKKEEKKENTEKEERKKKPRSGSLSVPGLRKRRWGSLNVARENKNKDGDGSLHNILRALDNGFRTTNEHFGLLRHRLRSVAGRCSVLF